MCGRAADEVGCTRTDADGVVAGVVSLDGAAGNAANIIGRGHLQDIMRRVAVCEDCENINNKYFASDVSIVYILNLTLSISSKAHTKSVSNFCYGANPLKTHHLWLGVCRS